MRRLAFPMALAVLLCGSRSVATDSDTSIDWAKFDREIEASSAREASTPAAAAAPTRLAEKQEAYEIGVLDRRADAFRWQATASRVIFWMVLLLVGVGVVFSALQFWTGLRIGVAKDQELDISLQGIKIKTQFLGVLTLAFSLAFFYLYLKTVYPITEVAR